MVGEHRSDGGSSLAPGAARSESWFARNKGLATFLVVSALVVFGGLFVGGIVAIVGVAMRSSDPYQLAVTAATHDPSVMAELGAPVQPGWLTKGNISVAGPNGQASLAIPVSGPRASGTINVCAEKSAGKWTFSCLNVDVAGRAAPIDLLTAVAAPSRKRPLLAPHPTRE
jgi:hypothetical protein